MLTVPTAIADRAIGLGGTRLVPVPGGSSTLLADTCFTSSVPFAGLLMCRFHNDLSKQTRSHCCTHSLYAAAIFEATKGDNRANGTHNDGFQ